MPYFLARQRTTVTDDATWNLSFPAVLTLEAELAPKEIFGESDIISPRVALIGGRPTEMTAHQHTGVLSCKSTDFLPPVVMNFEWTTLKSASLQIRHNKITYKLNIDDNDDIHRAIDYITWNVASSLSITLGVLVEVVQVRGEIADQLEFESIFAGGNYHLRCVSFDSAAARETMIAQALDLQKPWAASYPRLLLASVYYQQALRLVSPHAVVSPPQNFFSEVIVNLAKCLEILLAGGAVKDKKNDEIRSKCRVLGYSEPEIEGQIIPIMFIRNRLDGAHPVGTRIPAEAMTVVREFVSRSLDNVRAVLLSVGQYVKEDDEFLGPLSEDVSDRLKLIERIKTYVEQDTLIKGPNVTITV
jgi:hypothetical protein